MKITTIRSLQKNSYRIKKENKTADNMSEKPEADPAERPGSYSGLLSGKVSFSALTYCSWHCLRAPLQQIIFPGCKSNDVQYVFLLLEAQKLRAEGTRSTSSCKWAWCPGLFQPSRIEAYHRPNSSEWGAFYCCRERRTVMTAVGENVPSECS